MPTMAKAFWPAYPGPKRRAPKTSRDTMPYCVPTPPYPKPQTMAYRKNSTGSWALTSHKTRAPCMKSVSIRAKRAPRRSAKTPQEIRPTTEEILRIARTHEEVKADSPALWAKPTTWTKGIEWHVQQKKLMNDRDQKPSMRRTSPHNDPPLRAGLAAPGTTVRGGVGINAGLPP